MRRWTQRRLAIVVGIAAIATTVVAGVALKDPAIERWHLWKLESADLSGRLDAAARLAERGSAKAVPGMLCLLRDLEGRNKEIAEVARLFKNIGPAAVPELTRALEETRESKAFWRRRVFTALMDIREDEGILLVDFLETMSADGYLCVRLSAIHHLGMTGADAQEALPMLVEATEDPNHNVRSAAKRAVENIRGE